MDKHSLGSSIKSSCNAMAIFLAENQNQEDCYRFLNNFLPFLFGTFDRPGWLFHCKNSEDSAAIYELLFLQGSLFKRILKQSGSESLQFSIPLDRLPNHTRRKISKSAADFSSLPPFLGNHFGSPAAVGSLVSGALAYDSFDYFVWRFLHCLLLPGNEAENELCLSLYQRLLVEYLGFFLGKPSDFPGHFFGIANPPQWLQQQATFLTEAIAEFWLDWRLLLPDGPNKGGSVQFRPPSLTQLGAIRTFIDTISCHPERSSLKPAAMNCCKAPLFTFLEVCFQRVLNFDVSSTLVQSWVLMVDGLLRLNPLGEDSDFPFHWLPYQRLVLWFCSGSLLCRSSPLEMIQRELEGTLLPAIIFYSRPSGVQWRERMERNRLVLSLGDQGHFGKAPFSHERYQILREALRQYLGADPVVEQIKNFASLTREIHSALVKIVAMLQRSKESAIKSQSIGNAGLGGLISLCDRCIQIICSAHGIEETQSFREILGAPEPEPAQPEPPGQKRGIFQLNSIVAGASRRGRGWLWLVGAFFDAIGWVITGVVRLKWPSYPRLYLRCFATRPWLAAIFLTWLISRLVSGWFVLAYFLFPFVFYVIKEYQAM